MNASARDGGSPRGRGGLLSYRLDTRNLLDDVTWRRSTLAESTPHDVARAKTADGPHRRL